MALNEAKKGAIITAIATLLTSGGFTFYNEYILGPQIDQKIEDAFQKRKGSLSSKLAKELDIDKDIVAHKLAIAYEDLQKIKEQDASLFPKVKELLKYHIIGLKVETSTGRLKHLHQDGHLYDVVVGGDGHYYFIHPQTNAWERCNN